MSARNSRFVPEATARTLKAPLPVNVGKASECPRLETIVKVRYIVVSVLYTPFKDHTITLITIKSV